MARKVGRPPIYNDKVKEKLIEMSKQGKTEKQMAEIIGVSDSCLLKWKKKHTELVWALRENKQLADELVEASLYMRACGYEHEAVKIFMNKDGETIEHKYVEQYPPDTAAAALWLKNRKPDVWRDKTEVDINIFRSMTDEEIDKALEEEEKKLGKR